MARDLSQIPAVDRQRADALLEHVQLDFTSTATNSRANEQATISRTDIQRFAS
jgi:hypothetical protein